MKSRNEVSAGGVVYRMADDAIEVLICKDAGYHKWVLPKGLVNQGETPEQAAVREVQEEVGVTGQIVEALDPPEKYVYTARGVRVFKVVHYFLMVYESGSETQHDHEMEAVRWARIDEAIDLMGYQGAKDVLARARDKIAKADNHAPSAD
jgi:8-oxo-dGTP pyrophosphatase MutT (NUDIX family)